MNSDDKLRNLEAENRRLLLRTEKMQYRLGRLELVTETVSRSAYLILAFLLAVAVLLSMYPLALAYAQRVYNPTKIPPEYQKVITYLEKQGKDTRVMWLPLFGAGHAYDWAAGKRIGPFEVWSSNPSLNDYLVVPVPESYGYWLERELYQKAFVTVALMNREDVLKTNLASRLFTPFNARYMVLDQSVSGYDFGDRFDSDSSLELVFQAEKLKVYKVKQTHDLIWPASATVKAQSFYDDLCLYQKLSAEELGRTAILNGSGNIPVPNRPIDIKHYEKGLVYNGDFEQPMVDGFIPGWLPAQLNGNYRISYDAKAPAAGRKSLKVVNKSSQVWGLGWVAGTEIPATPGTMYTYQTRLKYRNTTWTHAAVEGFNESSQTWLQLVQCPSIMSGDSGWKTWNCSFILPEGYSKIRPMLAAGWVQDPKRGPATSWFDSITISRVDDAFFADLAATPPPPQVTFEKINAEKYIAHVKNATNPFVLVFGEAYDTLWVAKTSTGTIDPVLLYDYINGFPINRKGSFDVTIEYLPEAWYLNGLAISVVVILLCVLVLVLGPVLSRSSVGNRAGNWAKGLAVAGGSAIRSYIEEPPDGRSGARTAERRKTGPGPQTSGRGRGTKVYREPGRVRTSLTGMRDLIEEPPGPPHKVHPGRRIRNWVRKLRGKAGGLLAKVRSMIFEEPTGDDRDD